MDVSPYPEPHQTNAELRHDDRHYHWYHPARAIYTDTMFHKNKHPYKLFNSVLMKSNNFPQRY